MIGKSSVMAERDNERRVLTAKSERRVVRVTVEREGERRVFQEESERRVKCEGIRVTVEREECFRKRVREE